MTTINEWMKDDKSIWFGFGCTFISHILCIYNTLVTHHLLSGVGVIVYLDLDIFSMYISKF